MTTKLQKWGNSLGVRLPKEILKKVGFRDGKSVSVKTFGKSIIITSFKKEETLDDLLSKITPQNRHEETYWGPPVGNEVW